MRNKLVRGSVWYSVHSSFRFSVCDSVSDSVWESIRFFVRVPVRSSVWSSLINYVEGFNKYEK